MNICPRRDVLPFVQDPGPGTRLLEHPRQHHVVRSGGGYQVHNPVTDKLRFYRGLTTVLKTLYWPNYMRPVRDSPIARLAGIQNRVRALAPSTQARARDHVAAATRAQAAAKGSVRGSIVHRHLSELTTMDMEAFERRNPGGMHPWTKRVLQALTAAGKIPFLCDYAVYDEEMGVATEHDLIAIDEITGKITFIELKTCPAIKLFHTPDSGGYFSGLLNEGSVRDALGRNTACARAMVQLAIATIMAINGTGLTDDFDAWVVAVCESKVEIIELSPEFILETGRRIFRNMRATIPHIFPPTSEQDKKKTRKNKKSDKGTDGEKPAAAEKESSKKRKSAGRESQEEERPRKKNRKADT